MARVAVTGAAGFVGAYLTRALVAQGHHVVAVDNLLRGQASRLDSVAGDIEIVGVDVRDGDALTSAFRGVEAVFHLAAVNGTENFYTRPQLVLDVGVRGALAVTEASIAAGVRDLVVASSAEVYQTPSVVPTPETIPMVIPDPLQPRYSYGGSKLISELIAFNYGRDRIDKVQVFRPHNVYGPDMGWKHVIPQLVTKAAAAVESGSGQMAIQGDGSETRAFCYVDDIVAGILTMWQRGDTMNVYHIGSSHEVSIADLAHEVARAVGAPDLELVPSPAPPGGTPRRCPDIGKLARLGYAPRVSLEQGIATTASWYLAHPRPTGGNDLL